MKKEIVFATHNPNKAQEIQDLLGDTFLVKTLTDIGVDEEIPETGTTLEANAKIKSSFVNERFNCNVFSDDTGLEVEVLKRAPGVYSARYAGPNCDDNKNMDLLLHNLKDQTNRKAQFRTVISLFWEGEHHFFTGEVIGNIGFEKKGRAGFGYDPIFIPDGYNITFAEMSRQEKNSISHRGRAIKNLSEFLLAV